MGARKGSRERGPLRNQGDQERGKNNVLMSSIVIASGVEELARVQRRFGTHGKSFSTATPHTVPRPSNIFRV